jgi:ketosteroid isomerase-like protein
MSEENVKLSVLIDDAFNRGDKTAWLAKFDPDAEMVPARDWPESAPIRGAEAIWDFYMEVTGAWDEGSFEFGEVIDSGADKIVANIRREARGRASGAGVPFSYWSVGTYRNGKVVRVEWFADRADALEAAGLRE